MKILHTADWHLGQKLNNFSRDEEHEKVLHWLLETIQKEEIDLLIVAGDVFDVMNPQNSSRRLYYQFLAKLTLTACRYVVIIGGNHDSPNMLNAPKDLLESLNIFVMGSAKENLQEEILELRSDNGQLEAVVAAVPFLRDQELRRATMGETELERHEQVQQGIYQHYKQVAALTEQYQAENVPIIATGHLYATGAHTRNDHQDNIYMGNVDNISASEFPPIFDYIALGHIHTPQAIGNLHHIRYAGSIIPLSFKEAPEEKSVTIIEFDGRQLSSDIRQVALPTFRHLYSISGNYQTVLEQLHDTVIPQADFTTWLKVEVEAEKYEYAIEDTIREICHSKGLELLTLKVLVKYQQDMTATHDAVIDLDVLNNPKEIFMQKCESLQLSEQEAQKMLETFEDLLEWDRQQQDA